MSFMAENETKPHALCIPFPAQGHINPMLKLAKLLHQKGFYITFVTTEHIHRRLINSAGPAAVAGPPDFRFRTIPDGLPPSDANTTQDPTLLCESVVKTCLEPFCDLLTEVNSSGGEVPPVSVIISDGVMSFTLKAAERFELPEALLWTTSVCGLLGYTQYRNLIERGYTPLKDMSQVTNGYLETIVDGIPGMKDIRLRDFPSFIRTTDPKEFLFNFLMQEVESIPKAKALIINTFSALEEDTIIALSEMFSQIFTIGPLQLMLNHARDDRLNHITSSLWKQESGCMKWLDTKVVNSVVYVNFGSQTVITAQQLTEFAWGLANSNKTFLWIIRPDLVTGDSAMLPPEFLAEIQERAMLLSWCPQEQVLQHPAIGGFLTHSGWNSTIESIVSGVPVICWPFFSEQQTNCRYSCVEWEIGMEIDNDVKRDEVEELVRELMDGEKGKKMKEKVLEWKKKAEEATAPGGSSYENLDKLIKEVLLQ